MTSGYDSPKNMRGDRGADCVQTHTWGQGACFRSCGTDTAYDASTFRELNKASRVVKMQSRNDNLEKSLEFDGEVRSREKNEGTLTYGCHLKLLDHTREKGIEGKAKVSLRNHRVKEEPAEVIEK